MSAGCSTKVKILHAEIHNLKDRVKKKEEELEGRIAKEHEKDKRIEELNNKLESIKGVNIALKEDNEVLLERISFKHSELEKIKKDFDCEKCECKIKRKDDFKVHINSNHSELHEKNFKCKSCDLTFKREFDLNIHNSAKHIVKSFGISSSQDRKAFLFPNITKNIPTK